MSRFLNKDGSVKTLLDDDSKEKYQCHNAQKCHASWTYDDWHCTGCHWKGMGTQDLRAGDDELRLKAENLFIHLNGELI